MKGPLLPPPNASTQDDSCEVLRVWINEDDGVEVVIRVGVWDDPFTWGIALVDIARNAAMFYTKNDRLELGGKPVTREQVLERIWEGIETEWNDPTDEPQEWKHDA